MPLPRIKVLLSLVWSIVWMPPSVYPNTAIVAWSSRFLPRYDDGSLDQADLSMMSSPHIWNLLQLPRIKAILSLIWSIVWMPPSVYLTTAIVASSSFFLGTMLAAWTRQICLSCSVHIYMEFIDMIDKSIWSKLPTSYRGRNLLDDATIAVVWYTDGGIHTILHTSNKRTFIRGSSSKFHICGLDMIDKSVWSKLPTSYRERNLLEDATIA